MNEVQEKVQVTALVFYDLIKTVAQSEKQEERKALKNPTKASRYRGFQIKITCSDVPSVCLIYNLPDCVFTESPCQQDAPPNLTLPKGLQYCGESLQHMVRSAVSGIHSFAIRDLLQAHSVAR